MEKKEQITKEVEKIISYINNCIGANKQPILSTREIKLLKNNKHLIDNAAAENIYYLL